MKNDLRHRRIQTLLLLVAIAAAATTMTLGLALRGATSNPFARTKAATHGPDVVATLIPGGTPAARTPALPSRLAALEHANGVTDYSGPFPMTWTVLLTGRSTAGAAVQGRSTRPAALDQPKLLHGSWVRPGGVVVEAAFAHALDLRVGAALARMHRSELPLSRVDLGWV